LLLLLLLLWLLLLLLLLLLLILSLLLFLLLLFLLSLFLLLLLLLMLLLLLLAELRGQTMAKLVALARSCQCAGGYGDRTVAGGDAQLACEIVELPAKAAVPFSNTADTIDPTSTVGADATTFMARAEPTQKGANRSCGGATAGGHSGHAPSTAQSRVKRLRPETILPCDLTQKIKQTQWSFWDWADRVQALGAHNAIGVSKRCMHIKEPCSYIRAAACRARQLECTVAARPEEHQSVPSGWHPHCWPPTQGSDAHAATVIGHASTSRIC